MVLKPHIVYFWFCPCWVLLWEYTQRRSPVTEVRFCVRSSRSSFRDPWHVVSCHDFWHTCVTEDERFCRENRRWIARDGQLLLFQRICVKLGWSTVVAEISAPPPPLLLPTPVSGHDHKPIYQSKPSLGTCCFTSTEARLLIRDGDRGRRGGESEGSTADTARKRPERPWTAARTMEVLRRCPFAIAQRLVHNATAV